MEVLLRVRTPRGRESRSDVGRSRTVSRHDFELLTDLGPQHDRQMLGVGTNQSRMIVGELVGDPAAAGHGG